MFAWLLAGLVQAGTIYVDADTPVLVKVEGELTRPDPATRIIIPDLQQGTYKIEVTNLFGNTLAFKDVEVSWDSSANLEFIDGYLDLVKDEVPVVFGASGVPIMPHDKFAKLERKLVKGSSKKKLKTLTSGTDGYNLTMAQMDDMLNAFHKREDRVAAVYAVIDRCAEPSKYAVLNHHFAVTSDLQKVHALFEAVLSQGKPEGVTDR